MGTRIMGYKRYESDIGTKGTFKTITGVTKKRGIYHYITKCNYCGLETLTNANIRDSNDTKCPCLIGNFEKRIGEENHGWKIIDMFEPERNEINIVLYMAQCTKCGSVHLVTPHEFIMGKILPCECTKGLTYNERAMFADITRKTYRLIDVIQKLVIERSYPDIPRKVYFEKYGILKCTVCGKHIKLRLDDIFDTCVITCKHKGYIPESVEGVEGGGSAQYYWSIITSRYNIMRQCPDGMDKRWFDKCSPDSAHIDDKLRVYEWAMAHPDGFHGDMHRIDTHAPWGPDNCEWR